MYYTGFADEAGDSLDVQIKATKELGWENIESRNIDGENIHDISDEKFNEVCGKLNEAGIKINCFGSTIANWGKEPFEDKDYFASLTALKRAIPRMQKLGTQLLRGMSFAAYKRGEHDNPELEKVVVKKLKSLVQMCEDAGIIYLHENCMNFGGMSYQHTLKLLDNIKSSAFKLVYDTGNPVFIDNRTGGPPYSKQDPWEFYSNVKQFIHYVHIKDCVFVKETDGIFPEANYTFPGEGDGRVEDVVRDLLKNGYDGGFSMEPHLSVVFHDGAVQSEDDVKYKNYIEYGRRFMKLVDKIRSEI